jgi:hypothetical protein
MERRAILGAVSVAFLLLVAFLQAIPANATPAVIAAHVHITAKAEVQVHIQAVALSRHYPVRPGDTLSGIAGREYGNPGDWPAIYDANRWIGNPNIIRVGWLLTIPASPHWTYVRSSHDGDGDFDHDRSDRAGSRAGSAVHAYSGYGAGIYSWTQLVGLWEAAGGPAWAAATAACIALHESGGRSWAVSPTNDYGLWQINGSHGALATLNPFGNARAAVIISGGGRNWSPWTTHIYCGV